MLSVWACSCLIRGETYGSVIIGYIAALAILLFYWPKNTGYNLHCSSADPDWLDTGRYLGGLCIEPIQH